MNSLKNQIRPIKLHGLKLLADCCRSQFMARLAHDSHSPKTKPRTHIEREHYQNRLDDARSVWAFRLDEDTLDFVHCDLCLEALALEDSQAMSEKRSGDWKGKPFIETMTGRGLRPGTQIGQWSGKA